LDIATTPLNPGKRHSPYGDAAIIFWSTIGLAIAYWLVVGIARVVSAWGRGASRPGPGFWPKVENAGFVLASAISGERLATSRALLRFGEVIVILSIVNQSNTRFEGTPSLRDIIFHTQWCASLAMVAVQWPEFVCELISSYMYDFGT
jgi:hypothetical protein